ncbi:serpin family protein [candidate division KSB1 bacterium]
MNRLPYIAIVGLSVIVSACLGFLGCQGDPYSPVIGLPRDLTPTENRLIESDNNFGFKLFREINKSEGDKNIFISPLSVSMALGMAVNGAAGETETAMRNTLELAGLSLGEINESYQGLIKLLTELDPEVAFRIANSIWYRQGYAFEQTFLDINRKYFNAEVAGLDFDDPKSVDTINSWVDENTNGKIEEIIDSIDPMDIMFLINAIYFKGTWTSEFNEDETKDDEFTRLDGSKTPCKMMIQTGDFEYFSNDDFQAVNLPYGDGEFSMTVILPYEGTDINELVGNMDGGQWDSWLNGLAEQSVTIELPRFKLEWELKLNDVLQALGMSVAFSGEADFTKMYKPGGIYIDEVRHKTFVEVNEEGTEAAAVTIIKMRDSAGGVSPMYMRVDRPFLFVIHENFSQTILFVGKIVEPQSD